MSLRENKIEIEGRSMILNIIAILLNIVGVFFVAKGFHVSSGDSMATYTTIGFICFFMGIAGLVALRGLYMFSFVARAFVGGLFIVSGLVKANDPWGFAFKLEEYFSPSGLAFDFPFFSAFEEYTLQLSILICVAEIVLGVAVIVGGKIKLTSWLLVIMMLFFTWLTYYTFSCAETGEYLRSLNADVLTEAQKAELTRDCVTDCGCFGDALRGSVGRSLTPYESFWKDIVLFYFVLIIFINQRKIELNTYKQNWVMVPAALLVVIFFSWVFGWYFPIIFYIISLLGAFVFGNMNIGKMKKPWKMAIFVGLVSFFFSMYTTLYLPIKDYRPYKIGNNILAEMNSGSPEVSDYVLSYKNKMTNEEEKFSVDQYEIYMDTTKYEFVATETKVLVAGVDPSIMDFLLRTDYTNIPEAEKSHPVLDSIISEEFESYYVKKIVVESSLGRTDTIGLYDYVPYTVDTIPGADTVFYTKKSDEFYGLYDPSSRFYVDVTQYVLSLDKVILMTIRDMESMRHAAVEDTRAIFEQAVESNIPFYILSPATQEQIANFKSEHNFNAPVLSMDGTEIKIIVRSNPGLVILKNATVIDKWGSRSIPDFKDIMEKLN